MNTFDYHYYTMENSGENIIEELRKRVEDDAQRKSERIKTAIVLSPTEEKQDGKPSPRPINIFANLKKPEQVDLFGQQRKSVNLFQIKPRGDGSQENGAQGSKNIFNMQQKPALQNEEEDSKSGGEEPELPEQSQNVFKSEPEVKVMKYDYKTELTKNLQVKVRKFKSGTSQARQQVDVSLESLPNQPSTLYLVVRARATKVIVFQGVMVKNISKVEHFMGKEDNLRFDVLRKSASSQEEGTDSKFKREVVKLLFETVESCKEFIIAVNGYFGVTQ